MLVHRLSSNALRNYWLNRILRCNPGLLIINLDWGVSLPASFFAEGHFFLQSKCAPQMLAIFPSYFFFAFPLARLPCPFLGGPFPRLRSFASLTCRLKGNDSNK